MINLFNIKYSKKFPFIQISSSNLFSIFFISIILGILGFILETFLAYFDTSYLTDRGFLCGPFIPIYFIFSFISLLFFKIPKKSISYFVRYFFIFAILITLLEFITGNLLELLTTATLWNYQGCPLSYKYISLPISFCWGICASLFFMYLVTYLYKVSLSINYFVRYIIIFLFSLIFLIDLSFSIYFVIINEKYIQLYNVFIDKNINKVILLMFIYYSISIYLIIFINKYKTINNTLRSIMMLSMLIYPIIIFVLI